MFVCVFLTTPVSAVRYQSPFSCYLTWLRSDNKVESHPPWSLKADARLIRCKLRSVVGPNSSDILPLKRPLAAGCSEAPCQGSPQTLETFCQQAKVNLKWQAVSQDDLSASAFRFVSRLPNDAPLLFFSLRKCQNSEEWQLVPIRKYIVLFN